MSLYVSEKVGNEIVLKKYAPAVPVYRGFWAVTIGGFAGTLVECNGSMRYIGSNEKTIYQIVEPGTYTFTATRHGETKSKTIVLDDKDPNNSYTVNLGLYIGMQYLEYIESTGTQWIDTGISGNNDNLKLECEFIITEIPSDWNSIYGNYLDENSNSFRLVINGTSHNGFFTSNTQTGQGQIGYNFQTDTKYTIESSYLKSIINNTTYNYSSKVIGTENNTTILLFNSSTISGFIGTPIKLYSFKIYDNDVLVSDFVPIKDDTNHGALYDKVTQQIFYNSGEGDFICGPNKPYTRIQYIESTGTQWIDTGFIANNDTRTQIKVMYNNNQNYHNGVVGAGRSSTDDGYRTFLWDTQVRCDYGSADISGATISNGDIVDIDFNKNIVSYSVNNISQTPLTFQSFTFTCSDTMKICRTSETNLGEIRVYSCKIYDNGMLVRDMIPVLDNEGTPCMYDQENDRLYYNDGTGEFIAGPEYIELEYIESDGTQWIDTEFHPDNLNTTRFMIMCQFTGGESSDWLVNGISSRQGNGFYVGMTDTTRNQFVYLYDGTDVYTNVSIPDRFGLYTYDYNGPDRYVKITSGSDTLVNTSLSTITPSTKPSIVIFGYNNRNTDGSPQTRSEKIYYCKIYSEGVLVRDFIPVKIGTEVGMYDTVSQQFFTNAGTGDFIPGPEK